MKKTLTIASVAVALSAYSQVSAARDHIEIVGSSTVYPFATVVAENFGNSTKFKTPKIESTGSGGGIKLFCRGLGENTPDITNASRRMKKQELEMCAKNGVGNVTEALIGYDGIAFANSKKAVQLDLTLRDIYLALAKEVPAKDGSKKFVKNFYKTWKDVNSKLPSVKIEVIGPPPTSGTRDAFAELAMERGCKTFDWVAALKKSDKNRYKEVCHTVREDGAYVEAGENDNLIIQKLDANPAALGVFGFSFLDQNADKVQGSIIEGKAPSFDSIADGSYKVSRPLFFYIKNAHIGKIPGIAEYTKMFVSKRATGQEGYLTERGLIPLSKEAHKKMAKDVVGKKKLKL